MSLHSYLHRHHPQKPQEALSRILLSAPVSGRILPLSDIADETYSLGILGFSCGIEPADNNIYAPTDGVISDICYGYSISMNSSDGTEILIHAGIDTIMLKGRGFSPKISIGDHVHKGDLLLVVDLDAVSASGHPTTVITVITNSDTYTAIEQLKKGTITSGEDLLLIVP